MSRTSVLKGNKEVILSKPRYEYILATIDPGFQVATPLDLGSYSDPLTLMLPSKLGIFTLARIICLTLTLALHLSFLGFFSVS